MNTKEKRRIRRKMAFRRERDLKRFMVDVGFPSDTTVKTNQFLKWSSPRRKKYLKKLSNHRIRKISEIGSGSTYKKYFDLQWILW